MISDRLEQSIFIENQGYLSLQGNLELVQASCTFDQLTYHDNLFNDWDICFPSSLKRAVKKRKAEFFAGRYCAQKALVKLGVYPSTIGIGELRNPLWPIGIKGSISHNDKSAIAVVSLEKNILGIGVDIENIIEENIIEQTKVHILQLSEMKLRPPQGMTAEQLFTIIFSIKESFFKAAFPLVNAYFDFDAVSIINLDSESQEVQFKLNYSLHETLPRGLCLTGKYDLVKKAAQINKETSRQDVSVVSLVTINI
ncbi:MAG: 4'-phosphopantetheinyl transferase superfamily protein [Colwellia sp.]|nr:4'-phosphopantetheinyl transferase superfamily protein [Colwellia sp.]